MLRFQWHHLRPHPEASLPITWPLLAHPVRYLSEEALSRQLLLVGNPVLWWGFLAALPFLVYRVARRRTWQEVVVLAGYGLLYGPWLVVPRTRFLFFMLPAVPFTALGLVAVLRSAPAAVACGPVWLYLPAPDRWLQLLPLVPSS
jgi:dolichyl-phosphate-mannose-protein mannosyltransferase